MLATKLLDWFLGWVLATASLAFAPPLDAIDPNVDPAVIPPALTGPVHTTLEPVICSKNQESEPAIAVIQAPQAPELQLDDIAPASGNDGNVGNDDSLPLKLQSVVDKPMLNGVCLVSMLDENVLLVGSRRHSTEYRGVEYRFNSPEKLDKFLASPQKYVPVLDGNDPVLLKESGKRIRGKQEFGLFWTSKSSERERIVLFATKESMEKFIVDREPYETWITENLTNGKTLPTPPPLPLPEDAAQQPSSATQPAREQLIVSPTRMMAPVGGEVVIKAAYIDQAGNATVSEPLRWMLAAESVGNFVAVGRENAQHPIQPAKAISLSSHSPTTITRGTENVSDDVAVGKGEGWISLTAETEGVSRVTVIAPGQKNWDGRRAAAAVYWIDAEWQFPGATVVELGETANLTTNLFRASTGEPIPDWKVTYKVTNSVGTVVTLDCLTDEHGVGRVSLLPGENIAALVQVEMEIIMPHLPGEPESAPLVIGSGKTTVTWMSAAARSW